jgi:crossover junction endodeoxyribonuclease RuvC
MSLLVFEKSRTPPYRTTCTVRCQALRTTGIGRRARPDGYHANVIAIGIDPGTASCGFGVVRLEAGRLSLVDAGVVRTPSDAADADRLGQLHAALGELLDQHRPDRVAIERLFFQRNVQTAMAVGQARGVALLVASASRVPIDEPTPNEVKQAVCGSGSADKAQVATMVERLLGVRLDGVPDDATDALAVAIGCAYRAAATPKAVIG